MFISRLKSMPGNASGNAEAQEPFAAWTTSLSVHVKLLDNDHKKLLILLRELHDGAIKGDPRQILDSIFDSLVRCLRAHFAHEEQLFTETAFPGATAHERQHDLIIDRYKVLQVRFRDCADLQSSLDVIHLLKNSLFNHIESTDQEYVPHLKENEAGSMLAAVEAMPVAARRKPVLGRRILQGAW